MIEVKEVLPVFSTFFVVFGCSSLTGDIQNNLEG